MGGRTTATIGMVLGCLNLLIYGFIAVVLYRVAPGLTSGVPAGIAH